MSDHEILLAIQELLDGTIWKPETLEKIAKLLDANGYRIRDSDQPGRA